MCVCTMHPALSADGTFIRACEVKRIPTPGFDFDPGVPGFSGPESDSGNDGCIRFDHPWIRPRAPIVDARLLSTRALSVKRRFIHCLRVCRKFRHKTQNLCQGATKTSSVHVEKFEPQRSYCSSPVISVLRCSLTSRSLDFLRRKVVVGFSFLRFINVSVKVMEVFNKCMFTEILK